MDRVIVLVLLTAVAVVAALLLQRRRPDPPSAPSYRAPTQVDRADFLFPDRATLLAVFTSATCSSCAVAWETARTLAASDPDRFACQEIEVTRDSRLHQRYRIDGVPTTLVVDDDGVVRASFFGPVGRDELEASLSEG